MRLTKLIVYGLLGLIALVGIVAGGLDGDSRSNYQDSE